MPHRLIRRRLTQFLERLLLRGPLTRLFVIAGLIALIAVAGGILAWVLTDAFATPASGIWWAFLRLTDPGYLGDDVGTTLRIISTVVTVLGYVIFLGALVAIMTQWLNATVVRLQRGLTPVYRRGHIVVAGWSARTPVVVRELVCSEERVERFLLRGDARSLHVAILAEELTPDVRQELREALGEDWDESMITFRSGTPLRVEHLDRVDALHASVVILAAPPADPRAHLGPDGAVLKSLLALGALAAGRREPPPPVVTELQDARKFDLLREAYAGPLEVLANDVMVARLLAQTIRHPGSSAIYRELFSDREGSEIRVREVPDLAGRTFEEARAHFPDAIPIGFLGAEGPALNPPPSAVLSQGDSMVLVSRDFRSADPSPRPIAPAAPPVRVAVPATPPAPVRTRRLVILGWNARLPALVREFERGDGIRYEVDVLARLDLALQEELLRSAGATSLAHATVHLQTGEKSSPSDVARLDPRGADAVVILASDWLESPEESDARTMLTYLVVKEELASATSRPCVVVELLDANNAELLPLAPGDEVMVSSLMASYGVSQVALRRELRAVYDDLFGWEGPDITFRPLAAWGIQGGRYTFAELEAAAREVGDLALGVRRGGEVTLNPPRREPLDLADGDDVVVIAAEG